MKKSYFIISAFVMGLVYTSTMISCTDDDNPCNPPNIIVNQGGDDGDVEGCGGSISKTHNWTNNQSRTELEMDITSSIGGSFQIIVTDADGTEVLNETLIVGIGDDTRDRCSASGTSGTWTVTVTLTNFNGDGSFTLSQGC